jgi:serine protease Do
MNNLVENIKDIIIQTATPQGIGNGFYLSDYKLIITNLSLTYGANEVVISAKHVPKTMAKVLFTDSVFDLAFIKAPESILLSDVKFAKKESIKKDDELKRITQFYGSPLRLDTAVITNIATNKQNIDYLQYSIDKSATNKGGLLINRDNEIVGFNSFFSADEKRYYALPVHLLKQTLDEFKELSGKTAFRCPGCKQIIEQTGIKQQNCPICKAKIPDPISLGTKYEPTPTGLKIEEIIRKLNYEVAISRAGLNTWEIEEGSTVIRVRHDTDNQFIVADAVLCKIPDKNKSGIYEYLLKENNYLKGLSFKLKDESIILSMPHILESDFHVNSASRQFKELFNKADDYDDILIEMGAVSLNDED